MALALEAWRLTVTLVDSSIENQSTLIYTLNPATVTDYATAVTARTAILAALANVTDAVVKAHRLNEVYAETGSLAPATVCEVENIALLNLQIDGEPLKTATVKIPAATADIFVAPGGPSRNVVDPTDADLIVYAELFNTGAECTVSDGESTEAGSTGGILNGKRIHRKNSNG